MTYPFPYKTQDASDETGGVTSVAVGTTTTLAAGSSAEVTNTGTYADVILNFGIPEGGAATVAVGTVTTEPYTSPATVVNVGTAENAIFNFGIPQGDPGGTTNATTLLGATWDIPGTIGLTTPSTGAFTTLSLPLYSLPTSIGASGTLLTSAGSGNALVWSSAVTSVGLSAPSLFTISSSPITSSGTISLAYSGSALPLANGGTGLTSVGAAGTYISSNGSSLIYSTPVTSVAASVPSFLSLAGSPITSTGTLAITLSGTALPTTSGGTGLVGTGFLNSVLTSNGSSLSYALASSMNGVPNNYFKLISTTTPSPALGTTKNTCVALQNSGNANFALVGASATGTLQVFNVSNPLAPIYLSSTNLLGTYRISPGVWPYCYIPSSGGQTLYVMDLTNPYAPVTHTSVKVCALGAVYSCSYLNGYCYCATQDYGLYVANVSTVPPTITFSETLVSATVAKSVSVGFDAAGNLYTTDYLSYTTVGPKIKTWSLSAGGGTAAVPVLTATTTFPTYAGYEPLFFTTSNTTMFLSATGAHGLIMLINIATPTSPTLLSVITYSGGLGTTAQAMTSFPGSNYLYVGTSSTTNGSGYGEIDLFDITNTAAPIKLYTINNGVAADAAGAITVSNGFIYMGDYGPAPGSAGSLQIFTGAQESEVVVDSTATVLTITKSGSKVGTVTLAAGTATVANTTVTANSNVYLTRTSSTNPGFLSVATSAGSGFTITSSSGTDASILDYFILETI